MNGHHGANAVPVVERAKSTARGNVTNQNAQQITEDAKGATRNTPTVMLDAVQVSKVGQLFKRANETYNNNIDKFAVLQRTVIGLRGQVGVTAQYLVVMANREDKGHVTNQSVEGKTVTAANTVPRLATLHATQNVRALFTGIRKFIFIILIDNFYYTSWSSWSDCSKPCGEGGTRTRTRHCVDYTQYHKDAPACPEKKQIDTESCFVKDCGNNTPTDKPNKGDYYDHH